MTYSNLRKRIDERTDAVIAKRYAELLHLLNGEICDTDITDTLHEDLMYTEEKGWAKRQCSSKHKKTSSLASSNSTSDVPTVASEQNPNRTEEQTNESANFKRWLKQKKTEQRAAKKQEKLEKLRAKILEEKRIHQQEEKKKESELAFMEWLSKKNSQVTKLADADFPKTLDKTEAFESTNATIANPSVEQNQAPEAAINVTIGEEPDQHSDKTDSGQIFKETETKHLPKTKQPPELPFSSALPQASGNVRASKYRPQTAGNTRLPQSDGKIEPQLKKNITFEEWLEIQRVKSAEKAAQLAKEETEFRVKCETEQKVPARERLDRILNNGKTNSSSRMERNSQFDAKNTHTFDKASESDVKKNRISPETLRQSAAAAFQEWKKSKGKTRSGQPETPLRDSMKNPAATSSGTNAPKGSGLEQEKMFDDVTSQPIITPRPSARERATKILDTASIVNSGEVFALTALSESFDTLALGE